MRTQSFLPVVLLVVGCGEDAGSGSQPTDPGGGAGGVSNDGGYGAEGGGVTGGTGGAGATGGQPVEMALVHRVGRFDESDANAPVSSWSGTSFRTRVDTADGGTLSVTLDGAGGIYFEVVVDDTVMDTFITPGGETTQLLVDSLTAGTHDVEIRRLNEGFFGNVGFLGFVAADGATQIESPSPYAHRIEFIGDSITCGYGVLGPNGDCNFSADTESASLTYAAIAARNVNAAAHLVAYSGKGVFQNYGGDQNELMPELWQRTLTNSAAPAWDFNSFTPEAVVINLGTNDFSVVIDGAAFIQAYTDLLTEVRQRYVDADVFAVKWAHWGGTNAGYVQTAVDSMNDPKMHTIDFDILPAEGFGCDYHPSQATHARLGEVLTAAFETTLGW